MTDYFIQLRDFLAGKIATGGCAGRFIRLTFENTILWT